MELSALQGLVEQSCAFRSICKLAEEAAEKEDNAELLRLSILARQIRHYINTAKAACGDEPPKNENTMEVLGAIYSAMQEAAVGDKILKERPRPKFDDVRNLAKDKCTALEYLDLRIPESWDYTESVVVIIGDGMENVEGALEKVGQKRIIRLGDRTPDALYAELRMYQPRSPRDILILTAEETISDAVKQRVDDAVRDARVFMNTVRTFSSVWSSQGIENLPVVRKATPIYQLGAQFSHGPAILVAPGPSLDKNIKDLKQFKGKAFIVATSHTLKAMHEADIYPDLVVAVDSGNLLYHFEGVDLSKVGALAAGITCHPDIWKLPIKRKFFLGANATADSWLLNDITPKAMLPSGGSVATTILAMLLHAGCNPIVAVGLDSSFHGKKYYADGGHDEGVKAEMVGGKLKLQGWSDEARDHLMYGDDEERKRRESVEQPVFELPGYNGSTVQTSFILKMFHSWVEATARGCKSKCRFINATEGGAKMDAWEQMPLQQVYDEIVHEFSADIEECLSKSIRTDARGKRRKAIDAKLLKIRAAIPGCQKKIAEAIRAIDSGDNDALERAEDNLLKVIDKVGFLPLLIQDSLGAAWDRADGSISSYGVRLTTKDLLLQMKHVLDTAREWVKPKKEKPARRKRAG